MRQVCPALPAALLLLLAPGAAGAETLIDGTMIGTTVQSIAQALGMPARVTSDDTGNAFVFAGGTSVYADDDGVVLAVDARNGSPRVDVDGTPQTFRIGTYSVARADAELAGVAEFATPTRKSYRLAQRRDLVLGFADASHLLERVTYGEPGQLARLGLLPGDAATKAVAYRAPRLRGASGAPASGGNPAVYRIAIDRDGNVTDVAIAIPSAAPSGDATRLGHLRTERYEPAMLDGRPIAATVFVELPP